jgi:hypothetical protein
LHVITLVQGHSYSQSMFSKVYHISLRKQRESILETGLLPKGCRDKECKWKGFNYPPRIFVSTVFDDAYARDFVGYEQVDHWGFTVLKKQLQKDALSKANHYFVSFPISKQRLMLLKAEP